MVQIATESHAEKTDLVQRLAQKYDHEPWRVRILDLQRAAVDVPAPPRELLPADLRARYHAATAVWQANGFAFTTSEASSIGQIRTPYHAIAGAPQGGRSRVVLTYLDEPVPEFEAVHLTELMGRPSDHYFPFRNTAGQPLHSYLVLNPYGGCAYRCRYCSRLPYFGSASSDDTATLARSLQEARAAVGDPQRVRFVNVITGSQPSAEADLDMVERIARALGEAGFGHCELGFYTAQVTKRAHMERLRGLGVVFFTWTLESTTDAARARLHEPGNPKRSLSFPEVTRLLEDAGQVFPHVNATLMLGYEPADDTKRNLAALGQRTQVTINHYVPRIWYRNQYELLHQDARCLEYYVDLSTFIEREVNAGRETVGAFFGKRLGIAPFSLRYRS